MLLRHSQEENASWWQFKATFGLKSGVYILTVFGTLIHFIDVTLKLQG